MPAETILQVFDEYLGEKNTLAVLALPKPQQRELRHELRRFYQEWSAPPPGQEIRVFPGSWVGHQLQVQGSEDIITNDLLLIGDVALVDPLERYVTPRTRHHVDGASQLSKDMVGLGLVHVPSAKSGLPPTIISAHYPESSGIRSPAGNARVFLPVPEAIDPRPNNDWTVGLPHVLEALERWRPFIERGLITLVPAYEISYRRERWLSEMGNHGTVAVRALLEEAENFEPITSFNTAGLGITEHWAPPDVPKERLARHVSWVYSREALISAEVGALYAPDDPVDAAILRLVTDDTPVAAAHLTRAASLELPGLRDVSLEDVLSIHQDATAFAEVRAELRRIVTDAPVELAGDSDRAAEMFSDYFGSRLGALAREVDMLSARGFARTVVTIGFAIASVAPQIAPPEAAQAAVEMFAHWIANRGETPRERAVGWIARSLSGRPRRLSTFRSSG